MGLNRLCFGVVLVGAGTVGLFNAACGSTSDDPTKVAAYGGSANAGGAGNAGGFSGSGIGAAGGGGINIGGNAGNGSGGSGPNCGGDRYKAEKSQLDIYVMFDDSGSMVPWWLQVTQ